MDTSVIYSIFEITISVLDTLFYFWYFDRMLQDKKRKIPIYVAIAINILTLCICDYLQIWVCIKMAIFSLISLVFIKFSYSVSNLKLIGNYIIFLVVMISSEIFVIQLLAAILDIDNAGLVITSNPTRVIGTILAKTLYFSLMMLVVKRFGSPQYGYNRKQLAILSIEAFSSFATIFITYELSVDGLTGITVPPYSYSILAMVNLFALCCSFILIERYYVTNEQQKQLIEMQAYVDKQFQYYQSKSENQEILKNIYHDLKHHLLALDTLQSKNTEEMKEYMDYINEQISRSKYYHSTGNSVVDVILQEKLEKAEQKGIEVDARVEDNTLQRYPTVCLCPIFANALDNAIEASGKLQGKGLIRLKLVAQKAGISLLIENTFSGKRLKKQGRFITTKEDKINHGIGLHSIQKAVLQCNGSLVIEADESLFSLFILLP